MPFAAIANFFISIVTAFEAVRYMNSDFFTSKGALLIFSERAFYVICTFALMSIPAATFGFSAFFVRYNILAIFFVIIIIVYLISFAIIGTDMHTLK